MATFRKKRSRKYKGRTKSRRKYSNSKKNHNNRRIRKSLRGGFFSLFSKKEVKKTEPTPVAPQHEV